MLPLPVALVLAVQKSLRLLLLPLLRYIVEMEVVLPADMSVRDSHDISLDLQHKVTTWDSVFFLALARKR